MIFVRPLLRCSGAFSGERGQLVGRDRGGLPDELLLKRVREAVGSWVAGEG